MKLRQVIAQGEGQHQLIDPIDMHRIRQREIVDTGLAHVFQMLRIKARGALGVLQHPLGDMHAG